MNADKHTQLGSYRLIERIGRGGMGEVFIAHDSRLDRRVAIKCLLPNLATDRVARERLRREALAAAALDHPFICKVFEVGEDAGTIFIAMEYVRGETLFHRINTSPRLCLAEALRIAGEIAEAMEEAHSVHLIHRDLKPANIMLTSQGRVKIMDFGLARKVDSKTTSSGTVTVHASLTEAGSTVGTPKYMSPEQLMGGPLDERSDLFSFGIILCELLLGKHPFERSCAVETIAAILRDPPRLEVTENTELVPGVMVVIRRMLAKLPEERYRSMRELRSDLARFMPGGGATSGLESGSASVVTLIGRDSERDHVMRLLHGAMEGHGSMVLIGGEPGIGKTHMTRAILAHAQKLGCFGVTGHCYEMEGTPPYMPFIETLEYCARAAPPETFRYSIGDSAPEVAKLMPELRRLYPDIPPAIELPPEQQRRFLLNAYREFVERSARLTPIVAVFEDLHWADDSTLLLLGHLAQTVPTIPLLLIGTYRDVDLDVTRPFARALEKWVREKVAVRLSLRRLGLAGVQEMLEALSGKAPPDSLANLIYAETEGNPFFVEEVFQHLCEEGKLFDQTGAWSTELRSGDLEVPQGVRLVIGRRMERLRDRTRHILTTAAVIGRSFHLDVLEALEEKGEPEAVLDAAEEAERAQLVESDKSGREVRYRFVHELVRQTLADSLSLPRRQRLHARIAVAMQGLHGARLERHVPAIAHHLYQAGARADADQTIEYLMRAARQASAGAAHEEVLSNADKAVSLIETSRHPREAEIQAARAGALRSMARHREAMDAYESVIAISTATGDTARAVEASLQLTYIHLWRAEGTKAAPIVRNALRIAGTDPTPLLYRLQLLNAVTLGVMGDMDASNEALRTAKAMEPVPGEDPGDGFPSMCEARVRFAFAQMATVEQCARKAINQFKAAGDVWGEAEVFEPAIAALWLGRIGEVEGIINGALRNAERVGHRAAAWSLKAVGAQATLALGDMERAEASLAEAYRIADAFSTGWRFLGFLTSAAMAYYRGDLDEAERRIRRGLEVEPISYQSGQMIASLFLILSARGDLHGAESALKATRAYLPVRGRALSIGSFGAVALVLEGLAISGQREHAAGLLDAAEYAVEQGPWFVYSQFLIRTAAGVAAAAADDWDRAEQHFVTAIEQADSAPYRLAQPIARLRYSEMLARRGRGSDLGRSRQMLIEAMHLFQSAGMSWYAERAEQLMASVAGSPQ